MPKRSKLLAALDSHKGKDHRLERQKALRKAAAKKKALKKAPQSSADESEIGGGTAHSDGVPELPAESEGWESDNDVDEANAAKLSVLEGIDDSDSDSGSDSGNSAGISGNQDVVSTLAEDKDAGLDADPEAESDSDSDDSGIPLSDIEDLSEDERGDLVPHQRLTINNTAALLKSHKSIALPLSNLPFSAHQSLSSSTQISIPDVNDDLNRELAFYKQCLDAAIEARSLIKKEGVPFSRPTDYFAEMVKSDEHMGKIKAKMTEEAASKKAAAEARKQRDLKKFGKQVQVAKLQERDKAKRETLDKINILKRKRRDTDTGNAQEEDLFDVALEDATKNEKSTRVGGRSRDKRQKKDAKFGYGGKKRFAKSGDAISSGDLRNFSMKKMKGQKKGAVRLGKSRRAKP